MNNLSLEFATRYGAGHQGLDPFMEVLGVGWLDGSGTTSEDPLLGDQWASLAVGGHWENRWLD